MEKKIGKYLIETEQDETPQNMMSMIREISPIDPEYISLTIV